MAKALSKRQARNVRRVGFGALVLATGAAIVAFFRRGESRRPPVIKDEEGRPRLTSCEVLSIAMNHPLPHEIDSLDVDRMRESLVEWHAGDTIVIPMSKGGAGPLGMHTHTVALTPALIEKLRRGEEIAASSSLDDDHRHVVRLRCTGKRE